MDFEKEMELMSLLYKHIDKIVVEKITNKGNVVFTLHIKNNIKLQYKLYIKDYKLKVCNYKFNCTTELFNSITNSYQFKNAWIEKNISLIKSSYPEMEEEDIESTYIPDDVD